VDPGPVPVGVETGGEVAVPPGVVAGVAVVDVGLTEEVVGAGAAPGRHSKWFKISACSMNRSETHTGIIVVEHHTHVLPEAQTVFPDQPIPPHYNSY